MLDKLNVLFLLPLLFDLPHLLLLHPLDYLQLLPLLDPFLVLVSFLHQFLHVKVYILIDNVKLSQIRLDSGFFVVMQLPDKFFCLYLCLDVIRYLHPALEVVWLWDFFSTALLLLPR